MVDVAMKNKPFPSILTIIEEAAGRTAAVAFAHHHGGQRLYIQKTPKPGWLEDLPDAARQALAREYGGESLEIPTLGKQGRSFQQRVLELLRLNRPVREIARRMRLPAVTVYRIRRRSEKE